MGSSVGMRRPRRWVDGERYDVMTALSLSLVDESWRKVGEVVTIHWVELWGPWRLLVVEDVMIVLVCWMFDVCGLVG
jgi:hypothetical protein